MTKKALLISRILLLLYFALILLLCFGNFQNTPKTPISLFGIPTDKIVHFAMFLPMPVLSYFAFNRYGSSRGRAFALILTAFLVACLIAAGTELGQGLLTNYRTPDPADFRADAIAIAIATVGVLVGDIIHRRGKQ